VETVVIETLYSGEVRAASVLGDPVLSLSTGSLPGWLSFNDLGNGVGQLTGTAPASVGSYPITITASDGVRSTDHVFSLAITNPAANQPPVAVVTPTVTQGDSPLTVNFSGAASNDPDGTIVSYAWEFGEGTSASGSTAEFIYATAGRYTVRLTVTDEDGDTGSTTQDIVVRTPGTAGATVFSDNFATDTVGDWNTRGIDSLDRAVTFSWASSGQSGYDTTALAAPGVLRAVNPHSADTVTLTHIVWRSFPVTDLSGGSVQSDGIHSNRVPDESGFIIEYDDGGTTRWAITSIDVHTTSGATAVATAGSWTIDTFSWRALDWTNPENGGGVVVLPQTVLQNATSFGVYSRATSFWMRDRALQLASLSLNLAPPAFPQVTSTPPTESVVTGAEFSTLLAATDANGYSHHLVECRPASGLAQP
jgi:PKD repeat protein